MIARLKEPCKWEMLKDPEFAKTLPHLAKHIRLLQSVSITSIEELAMFLAVIRPAKKYLIPELLRCGWSGIEKPSGHRKKSLVMKKTTSSKITRFWICSYDFFTVALILLSSATSFEHIYVDDMPFDSFVG